MKSIFNRLSSFVLLLIFSIQFGSFPQPVYADYFNDTVQNVNISVNENNIHITGNLSSASAGKALYLFVLGPGVDPSVLETAPITAFSQYCIYVVPMVSGESGSIVHDFLMKDTDKSGVYKVKIGGQYITVSTTAQFEFMSREVSNYLTDVMLTQSVQNIYSVLDDMINNPNGGNQYYIFGIKSAYFNWDKYLTLTAEHRQMVCNNIVLHRPYINLTAACNLANQYIATLTIDEASNANIYTILDEYKNILSYDLVAWNDYLALKDSNKSEQVHQYLSNASLTSPEVLSKQLGIAVALTKINLATGYSELEYVAKNYSNSLNINLTGSFKALNPLEQSSVIKVWSRLGSKPPYTDANVAKADFDRKLLEVLNAKDDDNSPSSTGGGGGGSSVIISYPTLVPAATTTPVQFADTDSIPPWAFESINNLFKRKVLQGDENRYVHPNAPITREQFVKMLVLTLDLPENNQAIHFNDVLSTQWFKPYVATAFHAGLITGTNDNTFGVGTEITRQDMAVMLFRAVEKFGLSLDTVRQSAYKDADQIASYALTAVNTLSNAGLMNGMGENAFCPQQKVTRAMAAKTLDALTTIKEKQKGGNSN